MAFNKNKEEISKKDEILDLETADLNDDPNEVNEPEPDMDFLDVENGGAANGGIIQQEETGKKKKISVQGIVARILTVFAIILSIYCTCVFSNIPFIKYWRTIYIETAMGTMTHQWLATAFIPGWIIDEVMADVQAGLEKQESAESDWNSVGEVTETEEETETTVVSDEESFYEKYWELDTDEIRAFFQENPEYLEDGYGNILIEDLKGNLGLKTVQGDPLLVLDTYNNLMIMKVSGDNYQGKLAIMKNAYQVDLAKADRYGSYGEKEASYAERLGSLVTCNASRFSDPGGEGTGATIKGSFVIDGEEIGHVVGTKESGWKFGGFKEDHKFYISNIASVDKSEYIWGLECVPALIVNGESVVDGSFGMGIQPRTSVGQAENGDFMLMVVDGRQPGWSIGCTVADMADTLLEYGCYQALNMDGGSSSVMYYKEEQITRSSSLSGKGRYTPNAFVFMPLDSVTEAEE